MRMQISLSIIETNMVIPQKMKSDKPLQKLCMCQKEIQSAYQRDTSLPVLTIVLFTVAMVWDQPMCLSMG